MDTVAKPQRIDPRAHREEILRLFARNDKPGFSATFDSHYADDACPSISWCLRSNDGHIVGLISLFERRMNVGSHQLMAHALAETLIGSYKTELIRQRGPWRNLEAVEFATLAWVDWFNNRGLLEPIGNRPPAELEAAYYQQREGSAVAA